MRAPTFWWRENPSLLAQALRPASLLYGAVAGRRMRRPGARAEVPVICIGNFTAGGAGKTPTALAIAGLLRAAGETPAFLTRGYGGTLAGPILAEPHHGAADIGDEPLLLSRSAPTVIAYDRPAGARLAVKRGATVIIMDDGLQNPSLTKDLAIAVVDGVTGIGNGLTLPAGPLRAPMKAQWQAVDAVLVIGEGRAGNAVAEQAKQVGKVVLRGRLVPDATTAARLKGKRLLAFAGIGRPEKFFETLREIGAEVVEARAFADHHVFSVDELTRLRDKASHRGLHLVTTEKDAARIAQHEAATAILAVPVHLKVDDHEELQKLLPSSRGAKGEPETVLG